jgi:hypothetical protein
MLRIMSRVTGRPTPSLAGAWALALSLFACEPTPVYPPPEQPVVGRIYAETSPTATGADQLINFHYNNCLGPLPVLIPSGAYPAGARVTIRLVSDLHMHANTEIVLDRFLEGFQR